jgi:leucyl/phenylalanyl-tRNA--protein transferase
MHSNTLYQLQPDSIEFPNPETALKEPNGLIAIGGDLKPERILAAYQQGIFPWYAPEDPILWWSPNPRAIFYPSSFKPTQALIKTYNRGHWSFKLNSDFRSVLNNCAQPRANQKSTWISPMMKVSYEELHDLGHAHSVEAFYKDELVGGLYGVLIGHMFCGESMYHTRTDASKLSFWALAHFCKQVGIQMIDGQVPTPHLSSLGSKSIPRNKFLMELRSLREQSIDKSVFSPQNLQLGSV